MYEIEYAYGVANDLAELRGFDSMKTVVLGKTTLDDCVRDAQAERVVVTRGGKPVALVLGVEGLDAEQLELGGSDKFWTLISERRQQKTVDRAKLERMVLKKKR